MNPQGRIRRSRGVVCGLLLVLLGLWGGLAPFIGPYFHFGILPDQAWHYSTGRLYYSIIPGAAALVGGVLAIVTRSRAVGVIASLLAALGGAWFALGQDFAARVVKLSAVAGAPIGPGGTQAVQSSLRFYIETVALFGGLGVLVVFVAAIAIGRFSLLAASDVLGDESYYAGYAASSAGFPSATGQLPDTTTATFPPPA